MASNSRKESSYNLVEEDDQGDTSSSESCQSSGVNAFKNDGSFMEMFKRKMEEEEQQKDGDGPTPNLLPQAETTTKTAIDDPKPSNKASFLSFVGKRRGGKVLPTGMVTKKVKKDEDEIQGKSDAWTQYMAEVKRYKERSCEDEGKTRPLVK